MGKRKTKIPSIPEVRSDNLQQVVAAMKEVIEVAEKRRGDPLDAKVTYRDLVDGGIAKVTGAGSNSGIAGQPISPTIPGPDSPFLQPPTYDNLVLPGRPTNVRTMAVWDGIQVLWDWPDAENTNTYWKRAVIWASASPSFSFAQIVGYSTTNFFTHERLGLQATRYYWVAWEGNYNEAAGQVDRSDPTPYHWENGIRGDTAQDPTYVLNLLTNGITESQLYQDLNERIDLVDYNPNNPGTPFTTSVQQRILSAATSTTSAIYAAIAAKATTSVNSADGMAKGEYSVRVDANGYIAGFGLSAFSRMASSPNGTYRETGSEFIVAVDRFAIVWPQSYASRQNPTIPFVVGRVNGVNTVGINGQLVVDGTITARHIQAGSIGTAQLNAQQVYAEFLTANRVISASISTSVAPNYRLELNGEGSAKELYPLWFGWGNTSGTTSSTSRPVFFFEKTGTLKLAGDLYVTGTGRFFAGNTASGEYRLELGGPSDNFMIWAGTGTKSATNYVFYIDKQGQAKFKGTVEASFVSGEISRTFLINEHFTVTANANNFGKQVGEIPDANWTTVSAGGQWTLPAAQFDAGHIPYCQFTYTFFGTNQKAGAVRLQYRRAGQSTWTNLARSAVNLTPFGGTHSLSGAAPRVGKGIETYFRFQISGYDTSTSPTTGTRNGVCMGIR